MKNHKFLLLMLLAIALSFSASCVQQNSAAGELSETEEKSVLASPADAQIQQAKILVEKFPDQAKSHLQLAAAYLKKVRETGDYSFNRNAEESLKRTLEIEPESFEAMVFQSQIYLSEHKFAQGLEVAEKMDKIRPQNPIVYAAKTDALTELGRYEEAVETAQKFVDTRPNSLSYSRVAHLRALHGDVKGAIEARNTAIKMADPTDKEALAWLYSQLGKDLLNSGDLENAELAYDKALEVFPDYHWALEGKGKVLAANGDLENATKIFEKIVSRVPETNREIYLGDIYTKMGRDGEAQKVYNRVVERERAKENGDMHRVALFLADHDRDLDEALKIAREDREINNDLLASDTYAWALYKKGNYEEAKKQMKDAMRLNSKNALFYYHLGMIEKELGNKSEAVKNLRLALDTNLAFDLLQAEKAKTALQELR
jgi:tetratricopeptide (TPR) repeat protein